MLDKVIKNVILIVNNVVKNFSIKNFKIQYRYLKSFFAVSILNWYLQQCVNLKKANLQETKTFSDTPISSPKCVLPSMRNFLLSSNLWSIPYSLISFSFSLTNFFIRFSFSSSDSSSFFNFKAGLMIDYKIQRKFNLSSLLPKLDSEEQ